MSVTLRDIRIDQSALDTMLERRGGQVNRVMGGFASGATRSTRRIARQRIQPRTGAYIGGIRSTFVSAPPNTVRIQATAAHSVFLEGGTRPHIIRPVRATVLRFEVGGRIVFARQVNHPGTRPYHILRDGVREASRRLGSIAAGIA